MALGVRPGDEIITTPFSFIATAEVISVLHVTPVFVDIDPRTYNIDTSRLEEAITANTKAIIAVSLYGQCADFDAITAIARRHSVAVMRMGHRVSAPPTKAVARATCLRLAAPVFSLRSRWAVTEMAELVLPMTLILPAR